MTLCRVFYEEDDTVRVNNAPAAMDPAHVTRISSPMHNCGNCWLSAGEGLPLCMGSPVAMLLELPLVSVEVIRY